ncbi:MAG: NYN domain-containing protein [Mesorhizobium sp.]|nr:MAG: NYN domain-containing protein [Mesorhizobium sp.]RWD55698.1 MAG: NYN domain-containing protein [Mesorhizobium sp.]
MDRCAVFVDAGYLFAQGSTALTGSKKARTAVSLDAKQAVECLKEVVAQRAPDTKLLRIYWYDGAVSGSRPTTDQAAVAGLDDVKLRLGFINSHGQQKGVDSLIVTDMIELARLKSIGDAILLSGDEDVRVGVQIAQKLWGKSASARHCAKSRVAVPATHVGSRHDNGVGSRYDQDLSIGEGRERRSHKGGCCEGRIYSGDRRSP